MQIPETPAHIQDLDLMQHLAAYGSGAATYLADARPLGVEAQKCCKLLHANLESLDRTLAPLLAKVTAREMSTFTAHDPQHARKVAHLMWHIMAPARRARLTPPEIGLLIAAAYIHDLGMFLSDEERERRLAPGSDLWDCLEVDPATRTSLDQLATAIAEEEEKKQKLPPGSPEISAATQRQAQLSRRLYQAQEALLCSDNRSRHALPERYDSLLQELRAVHAKEPATIVSPDAALAFQGDSFLHQLLDICVSHNEAAHALVTRHPQHADRPRFPRDFPVGSTTADLQFIAAALRLADILDFDRERTPPVLFHYFIPGALAPTEDDRSALEWSKHLAITHWHIDEAKNEIVFRARCHSHIVHHGIVHFCAIIGTEITETLATFPSAEEDTLFALPTAVRADIHAEGYTYVPYRFELDDDRIYRLLMGGSIYDNPLHAIRELIQNAVDACLYRDAHEQLHNPASTPRTDNRITITYTEPTPDHPYPTLEVADTGSGMDDHTLKNYFLKVGRSFYNSPEFNQFRVQLRKEGGNHDFAPVSEFGIGFLSSFLLADKVEVQTALWKPLHGDTQKRTLEIHGPTRLMRLRTEPNSGAKTFSGTSVKLTLTKGAVPGSSSPPTWQEVQKYLRGTCIRLPYHLCLLQLPAKEYSDIVPRPFNIPLPPALEKSAVHIPVDDPEHGIQGQVVLTNGHHLAELEISPPLESPWIVEAPDQHNALPIADYNFKSDVIRGGFRVCDVSGLPKQRSSQRPGVFAIISLEQHPNHGNRYPLTNLSRTTTQQNNTIARVVFKSWMSWLLTHAKDLPAGFICGYETEKPGLSWISNELCWMERFSAYDVYQLATNGWHVEWEQDYGNLRRLKQWERSSGSPLRIKSEYFHNALLHAVLPSICDAAIDSQGSLHLCPPRKDWQESLKSCYDYITNPLSWGPFAHYLGKIDSHIFWFSYGRYFLNRRHQEVIVQNFSSEEMSELISGLLTMCVYGDSQSKRTISYKRLQILVKAQDCIGHLTVGANGFARRISEFKLPRLSSQSSTASEHSPTIP